MRSGNGGATTRRRHPSATSSPWREPIRLSISQAAAWWELGLRSVNLAHYGKSRYAVGTGDEGPVSPDGLQLLKEFERLGMILDATHLSDNSFFQALDAFSGPVLASQRLLALFRTSGNSATNSSGS